MTKALARKGSAPELASAADVGKVHSKISQFTYHCGATSGCQAPMSRRNVVFFENFILSARCFNRVMDPAGGASRLVLNLSNQSRVSHAIQSLDFHGPRRLLTSVLDKTI